MFTKLFWKDTFERAVSTAAQAAGSLFLADGVLDVATFSWESAGIIVGSAAALSVLKALGAAYKGSEVSPASLVK